MKLEGDGEQGQSRPNKNTWNADINFVSSQVECLCEAGDIRTWNKNFLASTTHNARSDKAVEVDADNGCTANHACA